MREFSWYTDGKPHISTYLKGAPNNDTRRIIEGETNCH